MLQAGCLGLVGLGTNHLAGLREARAAEGATRAVTASTVAGGESKEPDADPTLEQLRTPWMLLAQTVALGERDAAFNALAEFDAFAGRVQAAAVRQRAVRLFHASTADAVELSPRQLEVASLAAAGLTNREIANRIFVSPKTVEANLSRAYRKLGIHSRAELGAHMAERERLAKT